MLAFLQPSRRALVTMAILALLVGMLNAVEPLLLKAIFDSLQGPARRVRRAILGLVVLAGLRESCAALANYWTARTRVRIHQRLLEATTHRLHFLPLSFHREHGPGGLIARLERGIGGLLNALGEIFGHLLPSIGYLVVAMTVMFRLQWGLALLVLAMAPFPALLAARAAPRQVRRERSLLDAWTRIHARLHEVLAGIVTVKTFAREEVEKRRLFDDIGDANRVVAEGVVFDTRVGAGQSFLVVIARVVALAAGAWLVLHGRITAGTMVAFLGYAQGMLGPVQAVANVYRTLRTATVSLAAIFSILDAHDQLRDAPDAEEVRRVRGDVRFDQVRFRYHEVGAPLLDGIDLHVRPGELVAIVGPSGSGKSTLMTLLQRFYDPASGAISLDGRDLRRLQQRSLRHHIGVVPQEVLLFNQSVRANIAYARLDATAEEVERAARVAHAHEFIQRLPEGYDTVVGERGNKLSAGERQRIAIARAVLQDPPLLVLDEATSALDAESESLVQAALDRLVQGRTAFVVAHRLATVVKADRIVVLRNGRITETGTHRELLERDGFYARLVRHQVAGLIDAPAEA